MTSEMFLRRWKKEYLLKLREFYCTCHARKGVCDTVYEGEIVFVMMNYVLEDFGDWEGLKRS